MKIIGKLNVMPALPSRIKRLRDLAYNLYWSWTPDAWELYEALSPEIWAQYNHNPLRSLLEASQARLDELSKDAGYLKRYDNVIKGFDAYMKTKKTWFNKQKKDLGGKIAYFSAEFAFAESLPIYSGGLGVLAGDHCKSASDLGLPFVAVGLVYHQGYFRQMLNKEGWQEESYDQQDFSTLPLEPALTPAGEEVKVSLQFPGRTVFIKVWKLNIGRNPIYLLDTNLPENTHEDRNLTARLYGGGQEMRIAQELVLGVGGIRALRALEENISVYHMNEGHAAFLGLERIRELMTQDHLNFHEAVEAVASSSIFTTHTPVPAGNDAFPLDIVDRYISKWYGTFGVPYDDFIDLARHQQPWGPTFSMTVLALRLSRAANGVSELHGDVSRKMWNFLFPGADHSEIPIGHVTNGAHNLTFLAPELRELFNRTLPNDWTERLEDPEVWEEVDRIPDIELVDALYQQKVRMVHFVRNSLRKQYTRHEATAARIHSADQILDPKVLTIGFARRFATYKRATLLFSDLERLKRIVNNADRPVQFVFAGKAHPADNPGKEFIQGIYRFAQDPELQGKIIILENYDLDVARHLVQGVDIWLNNPRRPLEASGTSGMKASFNGALNFSILDGWWRESYNGVNGWAIGDEREFSSLAAQDDADSYSLYETLENEIAPLYYDTDENGFNHGWLLRVRDALKTINSQFSMQRQVLDYTRLYYVPTAERGAVVNSNGYQTAKDLAGWKRWVLQQWQYVSLEAFSEVPASAKPGDKVVVSGRVHTGGIEGEHLRVEAVLRRSGANPTTIRTPLSLVSQDGAWAEYTAEVTLPESGQFEISARVIPYRSELSNILELGLIKWA